MFPGACGELLSVGLELLPVVLYSFDRFSCDPLAGVFPPAVSK